MLQDWISNYTVLTSNDSSTSWRLCHSFSWVFWAKWNFARLLNRLHTAEAFDVAIICVGYIAMYLTFASLYISMKQLGSNFWLTASAILSSTFAFMCGFVTSYFLGVPVPLAVLSEGLPFLVSIIGFGGKIKLTRSTLRAVSSNPPGSSIEHVVSDVMQTVGFSMLRDYAIEILVLLVELRLASMAFGNFAL